MSPRETNSVLRDLDVCRSLFDSLGHILENNVGFQDLHSLAMLASEGKRKCDNIIDVLAG